MPMHQRVLKLLVTRGALSITVNVLCFYAFFFVARKSVTDMTRSLATEHGDARV
jgi:hypothetical protein